MKTLSQAIEQRRSYYAISNQSPISDAEIENILSFALLHVPSGYNSQSTRLVLLLGEHHQKIWQITLDILLKITSEEKHASIQAKIKTFADGYGTILFYEDEAVVKQFQAKFPKYKDNFPVWSNHTSAMHQFTLWTMLEEKGFGASLQHYNPLIDEEAMKAWNINPEWKLIAQMPFGVPVAQPGKKDFLPIEDRLKIFK